MPKPKAALFAIDDETAVLSAVARDLRREYGERYRILRSDRAPDALESLEQLRLRGETVALFLVDQRMPEMTGVDFLEQAEKIFPEAKRVLLTAYADTEAAIKAINDVHLDYYLQKPWEPPEERLYPVLTDLLDDWEASFAPPFAGIRIVGHRWSARSHEVKDFLVRNLIPYQWLDVEADDARELLALGEVTGERLPVVFFEDGTHAVQPTNTELAERVGLKTRAVMPFYDLIIVGAGPAGLAAAVYGASEGLSTLLLESEAPGGQAGTSSRIENYLGFPAGLSGGDLTRRAVAQASRFGAEILTPQEADCVRIDGPYRFVRLTDGTELSCHAMVVATGVSYRTLDVPGMDRLTGSGVFYGAAITEALDCKGKDVFIVGGGNSAGQAAMYLAQFARSVTILIRGASLASSMSHYLVARIDESENIHVRSHSQVMAVHGQDQLEEITIGDSSTRAEETLPAFALFIFIGAMPRTDWLAGVVERDDKGFILTGTEFMHDGKKPRGWDVQRDPFWLEASVPGIFVAGDVRHGSVKRAASAVGEGSMAVQFIHQHLASL